MLNKTVRQRTRQALLIVSLLLFPVTLNYFSPYVILDGAAQGIVNGSLIVFSLMFVSSLFVGRLWCNWACPAGGLAEACLPVNDKPVNGRRINWIKWLIWVPWLSLVIWLAISAGGYQRVNFFHLTESGISVLRPSMGESLFGFIIYYIVVGIFLGLAIFGGRRHGCHSICWMAPFMILGRRLRNLFRWPALRLAVTPQTCTDCQRCTRSCPMSLDVNAMVRENRMENDECILCGSCVDTCPQKTIRYSFSGSDSQ